jgi:hypothetical protein
MLLELPFRLSVLRTSHGLPLIRCDIRIREAHRFAATAPLPFSNAPAEYRQAAARRAV